MKTFVPAFGVACVLLCGTVPGVAYWATGPRWPSGSSIVMNLQQGASSGVLMDGSTDWNAVTEGALATWNPLLNGVTFRVARDSAAAVTFRNNINNVAWSDDVYGDSFGDAIAITDYLYRGSVMVEADVLFDRSRNWNAYRGNLSRGSNGATLYDLRRVALHEFGHVLGLGHPDEHGQSALAIMNSHVSNTDSLQADDINGVRAIYADAPSSGGTNRPPSVTASCNPCVVGAGQTSALSAAATDPDGDPVSYQWTAAQGTFGDANAADTTWTAPGQPGNVTATVTVQDNRGARSVATVSLQVVSRDRLPAGARLLPGQSLVSPNGRYRLVYQGDGNLVLYDDSDGSPRWWTGTAPSAAGQAVMQGDGNFVVYDAQGVPLWSSGTAGGGDAFLAIQSDGNLVLYRGDGEPLWWPGANQTRAARVARVGVK